MSKKSRSKRPSSHPQQFPHLDNEQIVNRYRVAAIAVAQGRYREAKAELESLQLLPRSQLGALKSHIDYTYAVLLTEIGESDKAIKLFQRLLDDHKSGVKGIARIAIHIELSGAYTRLAMWKLARYAANQAIQLAKAAKIHISPVALQNRAIALRGLGELDESLKDFLYSIRECCKYMLIELASIAAEQLAVTYVFKNEMSMAQTWARLAKEGYLLYSPQHLRTFEHIRALLEHDSTPSLELNKMPEEAQMFASLLKTASPTSIKDSLDVLDVDLYMFLNAIKELRTHSSIHSHVSFTFPGFPESQKLFSLLEAEVQGTRGNPYYPDIYAHMFLTKKLNIRENSLPSFFQVSNEIHAPIELEAELETIHAFYREGNSPWIWGQTAVLQGLSLLYLATAFYAQRKQNETQEFYDSKGIKMPFSFLAFGQRAWSRLIQERYIGLAEFEFMTMKSAPHIVTNLTWSKLMNRAQNITAFQQIGYSEIQAKELDKGGLIALTMNDLAVGAGIKGPTFIGGLPLNEINTANLPRSASLNPKEVYPGSFIDEHYHGWFFCLAPEPGDYGWYGLNNYLYRDHFEGFRKGLHEVGSVRVKHYSIPIYEARTIEELRDLAQRMPVFEEQQMWFRGQTRGYTFRRPPIVSQALFGREDVDEPSLLGAAPRRNLDYNQVHSMLQLLIQDYIYENGTAHGLSIPKIHELWLDKAVHSAGQWDTAVMALAQHYGIPTNGLDITSSLETALWFATNKYNIGPTGEVYYSQMAAENWPTDPQQWPVVYFILPVTHSIKPLIVTIDSLEDLKISPLRPQRQAAALFMGAHSSHKNQLAEALVCIVRIPPGDWKTNIDFEYLFPPPKQDDAYAFMLKLRQQYADGQFGRFFKEIASFAY